MLWVGDYPLWVFETRRMYVGTCSPSSISSFARGYLFLKMLCVASKSRSISRGERSGLL